MANPFFKGNNNASIGAPARVLVAASTYPLPIEIDNVYDLTGGTYNPNTATYGFVDIGYTAAPVEMQHSADMQRWRNEQTGEYRIVPTDFHGQVGSSFLQITAANKKMIMLGVAAPATPQGNVRTDFTTIQQVPVVHVAVAMYDHLFKHHLSVFPRGQWNGGAITETIGRGVAIQIPMTWDITAEDTIQGADGNSIFRYDIDQP